MSIRNIMDTKKDLHGARKYEERSMGRMSQGSSMGSHRLLPRRRALGWFSPKVWRA